MGTILQRLERPAGYRISILTSSIQKQKRSGIATVTMVKTKKNPPAKKRLLSPGRKIQESEDFRTLYCRYLKIPFIHQKVFARFLTRADGPTDNKSEARTQKGNYKIQTTNYKQIPNTKVQNSKQKPPPPAKKGNEEEWKKMEEKKPGS